MRGRRRTGLAALVLILVAVALLLLLWRWHEGTWWPGRGGGHQVSAASGRGAVRNAEASGAGRAGRLGAPLRMSGSLGWYLGDAPSVHVAGIVTRDGQPVAGARVELHNLATMMGSAAVESSRTDRAGHFDFGFELPVPSVVLASAGGRQAHHLLALKSGIDRRDAGHLVLDLRPCATPIVGRVVDDSGTPLAAVPILGTTPVGHAGSGELLSIPIGRSDADGHFSVCWAIRLTAAGGGHYPIVRLPFRFDVGDAVMPQQAFTLRGDVRDERNRPAPDALLWVGGDVDEPQTPVAFTRSGPGGVFRFTLAPGCYSGLARRAGSYRQIPQICGGAGEVADIHVTLQGCRLRISGIVRQGGQPLAGAMVHVLDHVIRTDGAGSYRACGYPTMTVAPWVEGYDLAARPELYGKTGAARADLDVLPIGHIRGRVLSAGEPVAGARVSVHGPRQVVTNGATLADASGAFDVEAGEGHYTVSTRFLPEARTVDLTEPGQVVSVDLVIDEVPALHGWMHTATGAPVHDLHVALVNPKHDRTSKSGADGGYSFDRADPGDYTLRLESDRFTFLAGGDRMPVHLVAGEDQELDLTLIDRGTLAITGRVIDSHGQPPRYARVKARRLYQPSVTVHPDGSFRIEHVPPGTYDLKAISADERQRCTTGEIVQAGGPPVTLRLQPIQRAGGRRHIADCF